MQSATEVVEILERFLREGKHSKGYNLGRRHIRLLLAERWGLKQWRYHEFGHR